MQNRYIYQMNAIYYKQIAESTAHRKSREENKNLVLKNPELMALLTEIAFDTTDKNHHKACWILELVCEEQLVLLQPYIESFCNCLCNYKNESAIRSVAKICMFLTKSKTSILTTYQEEKISEACLDWLIIDVKVASAAYAMRALFVLSKKHNWVRDALQAVLSKDYSQHSPGYQFAVKDILKKLNS